MADQALSLFKAAVLQLRQHVQNAKQNLDSVQAMESHVASIEEILMSRWPGRICRRNDSNARQRLIAVMAKATEMVNSAIGNWFKRADNNLRGRIDEINADLDRAIQAYNLEINVGIFALLKRATWLQILIGMILLILLTFIVAMIAFPYDFGAEVHWKMSRLQSKPALEQLVSGAKIITSPLVYVCSLFIQCVYLLILYVMMLPLTVAGWIAQTLEWLAIRIHFPLMLLLLVGGLGCYYALRRPTPSRRETLLSRVGKVFTQPFRRLTTSVRS